MKLPKGSENLQIHFDDIDGGGVVYHANYLRICDRARAIWFSRYNFDFVSLKDQDIALVIRTDKSDFLKPLSMGNVRVEMEVLRHSEKTLTVLHSIFALEGIFIDRKGRPNFTSEITLVGLNYSTGKSCPLPSIVNQFLKIGHT
jgi:acyl-CoA thioester hydrolase